MCGTPALDATGACADPIGAGEDWWLGESLHVPCAAPGPAAIRLVVAGMAMPIRKRPECQEAAGP